MAGSVTFAEPDASGFVKTLMGAFLVPSTHHPCWWERYLYVLGYNLQQPQLPQRSPTNEDPNTRLPMVSPCCRSVMSLLQTGGADMRVAIGIVVLMTIWSCNPRNLVVEETGKDANIALKSDSCEISTSACPGTGEHHHSSSLGVTGCALKCDEGFADCNKAPSDSCETNTILDSGNCGQCGLSCFGAACREGRCAAERVSVDSSGGEGNAFSGSPSISADGRFVAFTSYADNLVVNDNNKEEDVFLYDRKTGTTSMVSVNSSGTQGNLGGGCTSLSADGRFIAFGSQASNLVPDDTNEQSDLFVRDVEAGTTNRVDLHSSGAQATRVAVDCPSISADGRYVVFSSPATNLVGGDTNGEYDVFLRDRESSTTTRVSVSSLGTQGNRGSGRPEISADGHKVFFDSCSSNLVEGPANDECDVFVHERDSGITSVVMFGGSLRNFGESRSVSADGRIIAFVSSDDGKLFVRDLVTGMTTLVASSGREPSLSSDGRFVAFESAIDPITGERIVNSVFVFDRTTETVTLIHEASRDPHLSANGRFVSFVSAATDVVLGDTNEVDDIFVVGVPQ